MPAPDAAPSPVSFSEALWYWLKLGFISFGGPTGQIAIMHRDLVEQKRWISERRFLHALNYCMLLPGPEATQLATYIGWMMHKTRGAIAAGSLFVLPSLIILIALSWIYMAYGNVPAVAGVLYGVKPAVTALVAVAAHRIATRALRHASLWCIAAAAFIGIYAFNVPFPYIVLAAGVLGALGGRFAPGQFAAGAGHAAAGKRYGNALIDDDTPPPAHARFTWLGVARVCVTCLALWGGVIGLLYACFGAAGALTQMGWFFTKAALLTFGGAYAVLPYVYQGGVEQYHWLTAPQMMDGLALGETTPGPLIMVVSFIGFVGGWTQPLFGAQSALVSGSTAAVVATYFTFLPSFFFILLGAPFIESTHGNLTFTAPLTGITAAVVGVILNLAVYFAYHVLWPQGLGQHFDALSALIGAAALIALIRYKIGVIPVILACGAVGLIAGII